MPPSVCQGNILLAVINFQGFSLCFGLLVIFTRKADISVSVILASHASSFLGGSLLATLFYTRAGHSLIRPLNWALPTQGSETPLGIGILHPLFFGSLLSGSCSFVTLDLGNVFYIVYVPGLLAKEMTISR